MVVFGDHSIGSLIQMIPTALGGIVVIGSFVYAALRSLIGDFFLLLQFPDQTYAGSSAYGIWSVQTHSYEIPIKTQQFDHRTASGI